MLLGAASSVLLPCPRALGGQCRALVPCWTKWSDVCPSHKKLLLGGKKCFQRIPPPEGRDCTRVLLRGCSLTCGCFFHAAFLLLEAWLGAKPSSANADSLPVPTARSTGGFRDGSTALPAPWGSGSSSAPAQPLCSAEKPSSCSDPPRTSCKRAELCLANLQELEGQRSEAS